MDLATLALMIRNMKPVLKVAQFSKLSFRKQSGDALPPYGRPDLEYDKGSGAVV